MLIAVPPVCNNLLQYTLPCMHKSLIHRPEVDHRLWEKMTRQVEGCVIMEKPISR